jgi:hypothetical protein
VRAVNVDREDKLREKKHRRGEMETSRSIKEIEVSSGERETSRDDIERDKQR